MRVAFRLNRDNAPDAGTCSRKPFKRRFSQPAFWTRRRGVRAPKRLQAGRVRFYYYDIPEARRTEGKRPADVIALDGEGKELARSDVDHPDFSRLSISPNGGPGQAVEAKKRRLIDTEGGHEIVLWVAPSRDGGLCHWTVRGGGCTP
jgi:hypothetical protein